MLSTSRQDLGRPLRRYRMSLALVTLSVACVAGCTQGQRLSSHQISPSASPLSIVGNVEHLPFDTPQRMCKAQLVVDATVSALGVAHWNTPDGTRPPWASSAVIETQGLQIYRPIQLTGTALLVDHRSFEQRELVAIGGTVGVDTITENYPLPLVGQRYLLVFVPGQRPPMLDPDYATLILTDAFEIDANDDILFPRNQVLPNGQDIAGGFTRMPLSRLKQQLIACSGSRVR